MTNEELGAILAAHAADHDGAVEPNNLVADAEDVQHPLHHRFEWDNRVAGHKYRIDQARQIIRSARIVVPAKKTTVEVPMYIRDPQSSPARQGYRAITEIRNEKDAAREALVMSFKRVVDALRYAQSLAKVFDMESEVEDLQEQVARLVKKVSSIDDQPAGSA